MTSHEIARYAGLTLRQVQWWCEAGILDPGAGARRREFSDDAAMRARLLSILRRKGVSFQRLRELKFHLNGAAYALYDGRALRWYDDAGEMIRAVCEAPAGCFVVASADLRRGFK